VSSGRLLHGLANTSENAQGFASCRHIADPDPFASQEAVASWAQWNDGRRARRRIHVPECRHFYTDATLPD